MKQITTLLTILLAAFGAMAYDYDFSLTVGNGPTIYYNYLNDSEVEVTFENRFRPTASYSGTIEIPSTVVSKGKTYRVTVIGERAFFCCRGLTAIKLPESIRTIGMRAFAWCDAITEVSIPKGVEEIGANAFDGCYSLTAINVGGANREYSSRDGVLFDKSMNALAAYAPGIDGTYAIPEGTQRVEDYAFAACTFLKSVSLPQSLRYIGDYGFYFCNGLSSIDIPASVEYIGMSALSDCLSLDSISVSPDNAKYASAGGVLTSRDMSLLIQSPGSAAGAAYIPEGVKEIGEEAFFRNIGITNATIPQSVNTIADAAFIDCTNLSTVDIPASMTQIGGLAFAMCPALQGVYVRSSDPKSITLGDGVFAETDTKGCTLYVPYGSEDLYAEADQWSDFGAILPLDALMPQTISWDIPTDSVEIGRAMELTATASSGLPVRYTLTPSSQQYAHIAGDRLMVFGAGTVTLTASQSGNAQYLPAEPVTRRLRATSGITSPVADSGNISVYGSIGAIVIKGAENHDIANVYDLSGISVYTGTDRTIRVSSGEIYIVLVAGRAFKVAVR